MDHEVIVPRIRNSSSTKEKDTIYNSRVDNPLSNIEYSNKEEDNISNVGN